MHKMIMGWRKARCIWRCWHKRIVQEVGPAVEPEPEPMKRILSSNGFLKELPKMSEKKEESALQVAAPVVVLPDHTEVLPAVYPAAAPKRTPMVDMNTFVHMDMQTVPE